MSVSKVAGGDPRRPAEAKKWERPPVAADEQPQSLLLLLGMVLGMMSLMLKVKASGWLGLYCCAAGLVTMKHDDMDTKQLFSSFSFTIMGLVAAYLAPVLAK